MTSKIKHLEAKSAKWTQKRCQRVPKSAKREAKGSQKGGQREPRGSLKRLKIEKKTIFVFESVLDAKKGRPQEFSPLIVDLF